MNPTLISIYRKIFAPLGKIKLNQSIQHRLPTSLNTPLSYLLGKPLSQAQRKVVSTVEQIRANLAQRTDLFEVIASMTERPIRDSSFIAYQSSVTQEWGTFLYLCVEALKPKTILELGSCAGISSCYIAASDHYKQFITVEGAKELAVITKENLTSLSGEQVSSDLSSDKIIVLNTLFDQALDSLPTIIDTLDLVYIDGQHQGEARCHYISRLTPFLKSGSIVILDDVQLSEDLWKTWHDLRNLPKVVYAINVGRFGLLIWGDEEVEASYYDFSLMTGWLRIGSNRWKSLTELLL